MSTKRKVAGILYVLYYEAIHAALPKRTPDKAPMKLECAKCGGYFFAHSYSHELCERCRKPKASKARSLDGAEKADRISFLRAARICIEMEIDPREFIVSQFAMWREASAFHKKLLWPMPYHLSKLAARVRYLQYKAREDVRLSRVSEVEDQDDKRRWFVEERKLKGLARIQRRDPIDVLTEQPEEFSREFLKHKGVWGVVGDVWEERQRS